MERIHATRLDEIRQDHLLRYELAKEILVENNLTSKVLDAGCGIGYGAKILSKVVTEMTAIDLSSEAFDWHKNHFAQPNVNFICGDVAAYDYSDRYDAVVSFEFLEHIHNPEKVIKAFSKVTNFLICSTPNELVRPHAQPPVNPYHVRHYTPDEFSELLAEGGYVVRHWYNQKSGAEPELRDGTNGKFMIAVATKERD